MTTERVVLRAVDIESARHGSVRIAPMRFTVERGELVALLVLRARARACCLR
jgi:hypothetical protein